MSDICYTTQHVEREREKGKTGHKNGVKFERYEMQKDL